MVIFEGTALMPGSCGELIQGTLDSVNFHVTCPVNLFSKVKVSLKPFTKRLFFPPSRVKTARAVRILLDALGYPEMGGIIEVSSAIPLGKGMASSTADIAAACYAVAAALRIEISSELVQQVALSIEPSDGIFLPGISLFDHVRGRLAEHLGEALPLGILALDPGGSVDTLEFNKRSDLPYYNRINELEVRKGLELVRKGLQTKDPRLLGEGATISTCANQKILPKPRIYELIDFVIARGAYGVNVAHSGTVVGILLPLGEEENRTWNEEISQKFPEFRRFYRLRLVSGGPRCLGKVRKRGK
jgi:L-threonine kinase